MKKNDILLIVVIAIVAGTLSLVIANFIFGGEQKYNLKAPTVEAISADFPKPDERYFNAQALNPTRNIVIGDSANNEPFKGQ